MKDTDASFQTSSPSALLSLFNAWPQYSEINRIMLTSELSIAEKREILSAWASDARAVAGAPALRRLDNGATVGVHHILDALKTLDAPDRGACGARPKDSMSLGGSDPSRRWVRAMFRRRRRDDDDDDPPPCPAVISPFPRLPSFGAQAALEAA